MTSTTTAPVTRAPKVGRRRQAGLVMIGVGLVVAAVAGGMALFGGGGGKPKAAAAAQAADKHAYTTTVVANWWNGLPATQHTTDCKAYKANPKGTVTTIQSAITSASATAGAVFDPTALDAFFSAHCSK